VARVDLSEVPEPAQAADPEAQRALPDRLGPLAAAVGVGSRVLAATAAGAVWRERRDPTAAVLVDQLELETEAPAGPELRAAPEAQG